MGSKSKNTLAKMEETRYAYNAGMLLKQVAAGLSSGRIEFTTEDGTTEVIDVPCEVNVEFEAKRKAKDDGTKTKISIEVEWFEETLPCGCVAVCTCGACEEEA
ncbi:amphi-Trp domain-containing protein [Desulfohalovibrio reitneri]|uniref:amphi-Trp domain-containing protein n=1 Tax=Desulfohalovibrio reitneri TaxID=1307759 RepID=UPI00054D10D5|nr:amphi-Trp domain-containing protein [Desulfohalovibrio reitneri]